MKASRRCDCDPYPLRKTYLSDEVEYVHQAGCPTGLGAYALRRRLQLEQELTAMMNQLRATPP